MVKNPCPLIARSRLLLVNSILPWPNCWATDESRTPLPMAIELTPEPVTENTSANSAREPLKPTELTLAMLLAVTSRSEEHTSELQSLMRISYAVLCLKKKTQKTE